MAVEGAQQLCDLAFTRYCLTSRLLCTNHAFFYFPLLPALPALLKHDCASIAQYAAPPPTNFFVGLFSSMPLCECKMC